MSKEQTAIGPWLYFALLIIPAIAFGLLNMPYYAAKVMGANGYWAEIIAAFFVLPGIAAIYLLARHFTGQTIIQQGNSILGPFLGRITGLIYLFGNLIILTMITRDFVNMIGTFFLDRTPTYTVALVLLGFAAYAGSRGIETVSRLAVFVMIPALLVLLGLMVTGFQNIKWTHVLPIASPNIGEYFKGGLAVVYIYYLIGASAISIVFLKPLKTFPRLAGGALLFLAIFYAVYVLGSIGVFGHQYILRYSWPSVEFVHEIDFPYFLLEQAGLLLLIVLTALSIVGTGYFYYTTALGFAEISGFLDYKRWIWLLFPLKFIMIMLPRDVTQTKEVIDLIVRYGWIILFAYPILLWLVALLFGRRGQSSDAL
jgi:spore germination protein